MAAGRRLNVLVVPAWYPSEALPVNGVFVREQVLAAALHHDMALFADDGPSQQDARFAVRDADEPHLRVIRTTHRPSRVPFVAASAYVRALLTAVDRLTAEGRRPDLIHGHVYTTGLAALIAARRHRIPS